MTTAPSNQPAVVFPPSGDDEIDLRQVTGALGRHRRLIAKVAGASLVLSGIYAFLSKTCMGRAVSDCARRSGPSSGGKPLSWHQTIRCWPTWLGLEAVDRTLETEVKILESPLVLKPVYDFVQTAKSATPENT